MLAVGTGLRSLRLYDVRKARESATDVDTRATFGICFDPFESTRMASFGAENGVVEFWDTRKMPVPVLSIRASAASESQEGAGEGRGRLMQVAFSPRRRGLVGTLSAEARHVRLWTLMGPHPEAVSFRDRSSDDDGDGSKDSTASPSGTLNDGAQDYITAKNSSSSAGEIPLVVGNVRSGKRPVSKVDRSLISDDLSY